MLGKLLCAYLIVSCCPKPLAVTIARQQTQQQHQQKQVKQLVKCGGDISSSDKGTIQTPYFPGPFPVPIRCQWVIDASDRFPPNNYSIVIYLTQLYVTTGLTFTEFAYYEKGATSIGRQLVHSVTEQNVTRVHWLWTRSPFLVIDFELDRLEGNHLRVMDNLLDVYGFNITYEISGRENPVRTDSCNVLLCSFLGNCYANKDYTSFGCSCFQGFSGPNCGRGPGCETGRHMCENGASCWHMGSDAVLCNCTPGFTGRRCEIPLEDPRDTEECGDSGCVFQCPYQPGRDEVCNCSKGTKVVTDRARYEGTVRLANLTALRDNIAAPGYFTRTLHEILEKQISKYLRNSNLSKMEELTVLNITPGAEVTFHFFGGKRDGNKVREALNNLMKRGRLGNLTFVPTHLAFKQEPTLLVQSVKVNQDRIVKEGDEFILSCIAQGSSYMTFRWYKDGAFVNRNKTMRNMWTKLLPMDSEDRYTALLGIEHASHLDEGVYTCQVVDWGIQQCKSIRLQILVHPEVDVIPKSITIERGKSVSIKCMSPNDQQHEKFGYNWTKNKILLRMIPGVEVWEDLHPAGSILRIYNAQRSAEYTCTVHGSIANVAKSVYVEVVNRSLVPVCAKEQMLGIEWPQTAPDLDAIQDCPHHYLGVARRRCTLHDTYSPKWDLPDFSSCISEIVEDIYNKFRSLMLGYQNTTGPEILVACLQYLMHHVPLYPGEGEAILDMLQDILLYMNFTDDNDSLIASAQNFYKVINILLETNKSIVNTNKVIMLQELIKTEALLWGSLLTTNTNNAHVNLSSLALYIALLEDSLYKLHLNGSSLFLNNLDVYIENTSSDAFGNGTFSIIVILYRNLTEFLPIRYIANHGDGNEMELEINSRVVTVEMGRDGHQFVPNWGMFHIDLEFEHVTTDYNSEKWNISCGVTYVAAPDHSWDLASCITRTINTNLTKCSCNRPGTYAALLTTRTRQIPHSAPEHYHTIVLIGCVCCLVQAMFTLFLLLPYWWYHRTCLIFLKLQCCTATSGAMGVFIYAVRDSIPKSTFPYVTTSLEAFLLIGMSSHLSKMMIVYTEVVQIPKVRHMKQTVVSIITGVPVLAVLCNHLAHHSTGWQLKSWWLLCGTMLFNIFIASAIVMMVLFLFLYLTVMRRLRLLSSKSTMGNKSIRRREGLLKRAGIIFFIMVIMEASSIFYINVPDPISHYMFGFTSAFLGFAIVICYILKSEAPPHIQVLRKLKLETTPEEEFSSESVNSPLRFFTKQEGDAESEGPPPRPSHSAVDDDDDGDPTEGLLMVETTNRCYQKTCPLGDASSTIETYVHSVDGSAEDCNINASAAKIVYHGSESRYLMKGDSSNVDIESYHDSPRKYKQQLKNCQDGREMFTDYVEQNTGLPCVDSGSGDQWRFVRGFYRNGTAPTIGAIAIPRPEPAQCYIKEQTPPQVPGTLQQEIVTTRVCVELGVITTPRQHVDCQGGDCSDALDTPAFVLCSVDVEPCHRGVLDLSEMTDSNLCFTNESQLTLTQKEPKEVEVESASNDLQCVQEPPSETTEPEAQYTTEESDKPSQSVTEAEEDMLDRISHDLDYLLNRSPQNNDDIHGASSFSKKTCKTPVTNVCSKIDEADEKEVFLVPSESDISKGRTDVS